MKQLIKGRPAFFDHYHERTKRTLGRDGGGGGGSKADVRFVQALKMTAILFQQNHHFIAFYSYAFRGREGFAKRVRCVRS